MFGSILAEAYFIAAMMVIILIVCGLAVYFFVKTYKKEMRERDAEKAARREQEATTKPTVRAE